MKSLRLNSYAKINLSLDVLGVRDDGYHDVSMIMQQIDLKDSVLVRLFKESECGAAAGAQRAGSVRAPGAGVAVEFSSNRPYLPRDERNLACRAAVLFLESFKDAPAVKRYAGGLVRIDIKKVIPVGAGLAGGSGNAAAVLLALNHLFGLARPLEELLSMGEALGADVPFCLMGQARCNSALAPEIKESKFAASAALAEGTGTSLRPIAPLKSSIVLVKPAFSVSTKEAYQGVDRELANLADAEPSLLESAPAEPAFTESAEPAITKPASANPVDTRIRRSHVHPDNEALMRAIEAGNLEAAKENMINTLELYTLKAYPRVREIKEMLLQAGADTALMSGSGPTVYAIYKSRAKAECAYNKMKKKEKEVFLTKTTL